MGLESEYMRSLSCPPSLFVFFDSAVNLFDKMLEEGRFDDAGFMTEAARFVKAAKKLGVCIEEYDGCPDKFMVAVDNLFSNIRS